MRTILLIFLFLLTITACNKPTKKLAGRIDIELVVYHDPLNNMYNVSVIPISTMFFKNQNVIEYLINDSTESFIHIHDNKYYFSNMLDDLLVTKPNQPVSEKNVGVRFINDHINGYENRQILTDTSFNGYNYKRIAIADSASYSVFYVHQTDTILPFSLGSQMDKEYTGILNRVDVFNKINNTFSSLRMSVNDTIPNKIYNVLKKL